MAFLRVLIAAILLFANTPSFAKNRKADYSGADAGYLIYSVGTIRIGMDFTFPYRRTSQSDGIKVGEWDGRIEPSLGGMWVLKIKNPDFSGLETGHVIIRRLPPGQYAIEDFHFGGSMPGVATYSWSSAKPFVIPFSITPNQATYIGSYMRSPSFGTPLQPQLGAAGFFVISDQAARDLPIARRKVPQLEVVNSQVTNVDSFGNPALRNQSP
jgi:hypothetical protein